MIKALVEELRPLVKAHNQLVRKAETGFAMQVEIGSNSEFFAPCTNTITCHIHKAYVSTAPKALTVSSASRPLTFLPIAPSIKSSKAFARSTINLSKSLALRFAGVIRCE